MNQKAEKPMVTVDIVVFTVKNGDLNILLVKRKFNPFKGKWALPGGFIREKEEIKKAAARELEEETGVSGVYLEQLYTFGEVKRDPRGRVITVAYFALVPDDKFRLRASYDAEDVQFFSTKSLPLLAFDHKEILQYAIERLRNKIQYTNVAWSLLPSAFTLREIQDVYQAIWGRHLDKRNFRKKLLSLGLLRSLKRHKRGSRQRPAQLHSFKSTRPIELKRFF